MPIALPYSTGARRSGPKETVALLAGLMALNAFAIDAMIPALPDIGSELGVTTENMRQLVVVAYFFGFGVGQIFWGPLADRFGRKPILAIGVALYAGFGLLCGIAGTFELLIAGRIAMGASAAVTRVLVTAMVRDLFEGEEMARVMSLVFMVFMVVPMLAPNIGQGILLVADWRAIFLVLAGYGASILLWSLIRLPETLHPEFRRALNAGEIWAGVRTAASDRLSIGYTLALTAVFGMLTGYISSIQQIVFDVFDSGGLIGLVFAAIAGPMVFASWGNSRVVGRFGLRRTGHCRPGLNRRDDRDPCHRRRIDGRTAVAVHPADAAHLRQFLLHDVELRHAGDDQYGADRGNGLFISGRHRHDRRCTSGPRHWPIVRRDPAAVPDRLRTLRVDRPWARAVDRARQAVCGNREAGR